MRLTLCINGKLMVTIIITCTCTFRGSKFRKEFGHLGEVRGLFPPDVNIMALTATADRKLICKILGMHKPTYIV